MRPHEVVERFDALGVPARYRARQGQEALDEQLAYLLISRARVSLKQLRLIQYRQRRCVSLNVGHTIGLPRARA